MDHYSDGLRRRQNSPVISDGVIDELGKNCGLNVFTRHDQSVQELKHRRSSLGFDADMSIHYAMAEISVRGTDRFYHANEYEEAIIHRKKTQ